MRTFKLWETLSLSTAARTRSLPSTLSFSQLRRWRSWIIDLPKKRQTHVFEYVQAVWLQSRRSTDITHSLQRALKF